MRPPVESPGGSLADAAAAAAAATPMPLLPTGTARALFHRGSRPAALSGEPDDPEALYILPVALCQKLHRQEVTETTVWAAHELAATCASSPLDERRAVALLALALVRAMDEGSVHLPLEPEPLTAALERLFGAPTAADDDASASASAALVTSTTTAALALAESLRQGALPLRLAHVFGAPGARTPLVLAPRGLYAERVWRMEVRVSRHLRRRLQSSGPDLTPANLPPPPDSNARLTLDGSPSSLTDEQRQAVDLALCSRLALITGGPGTGKTSSVVALLRALLARGVDPGAIALAAPTGRAAQRLTDSIGAALAVSSGSGGGGGGRRAVADATTLHRLIGIGEERLAGLGHALPRFHARWQLPQQMVIVDEASMIDLPLMDALLEAMRADAQLVLLGDADQLASVELGAVFRDLVTEAPARAVARLTRSHRAGAQAGRGGIRGEADSALPDTAAGSAILAAAAAINQGVLTPERVSELFRTAARPSDLGFRGTELLPAGALEPFLAHWWDAILDGNDQLGAIAGRCFTLGEGGLAGPSRADDAVAVAVALDVHARSRVLCLARQSPWEGSTAAVNQTLHQLCRRAGAVVAGTRAARTVVASSAVVPGSPVIFLSNDYGRGLFNGDVGVVVRASSSAGAEEALHVAFARGNSPDGLLWYPFEDLRARLELAFALTVHKAQGSEYDHVALILPPRDIPLLSREILYTALTRARRSTVVIGDPALLARAAARPRLRASGLDLGIVEEVGVE